MKCFRPVLVGFVVVACFFLAGFKKPLQNHDHPNKKQQVSEEGKSQQKPLDLSVPQRNVSFEAPETIAVLGGALPGALTADNQSKARTVELQGKVIMSQEPEAGKIKSADGAGIMINLHH
ncbi:MAG: hypothetical protein HOO93_07620 [Methyloglobulus sp.]|nr:hypothetical protein [Methyloglobulus sp.]